MHYHEFKYNDHLFVDLFKKKKITSVLTPVKLPKKTFFSSKCTIVYIFYIKNVAIFVRRAFGTYPICQGVRQPEPTHMSHRPAEPRWPSTPISFWRRAGEGGPSNLSLTGPRVWHACLRVQSQNQVSSLLYGRATVGRRIENRLATTVADDTIMTTKHDSRGGRASWRRKRECEGNRCRRKTGTLIFRPQTKNEFPGTSMRTNLHARARTHTNTHTSTQAQTSPQLPT